MVVGTLEPLLGDGGRRFDNLIDAMPSMGACVVRRVGACSGRWVQKVAISINVKDS